MERSRAKGISVSTFFVLVVERGSIFQLVEQTNIVTPVT